MVAVKMADEDVLQAVEAYAHPPHGQLRAFAAVNHHKPVAEVDYLSRRIVAHRGSGRSASEYIYLKFCHYMGFSGLFRRF